LTRIGDERHEQLDIESAKVKVLRHLCRKYACFGCEKCLITATKPGQPIEKSTASLGLLAYAIVSKYVDVQPLYRQIAIFKHIGMALDRTTLASVVRSKLAPWCSRGSISWAGPATLCALKIN